jgi:hypothetical protein
MELLVVSCKPIDVDVKVVFVESSQHCHADTKK